MSKLWHTVEAALRDASRAEALRGDFGTETARMLRMFELSQPAPDGEGGSRVARAERRYGEIRESGPRAVLSQA